MSKVYRDREKQGLITNHCPHSEDTPVGELCKRCEQKGVGIIELDTDGEGVVTFLMPLSQGLVLQELRELVPQETQDEALVRRKLMIDQELEEAMLSPYEEGHEVAEEDALEAEPAYDRSGRGPVHGGATERWPSRNSRNVRG